MLTSGDAVDDVVSGNEARALPPLSKEQSSASALVCPIVRAFHRDASRARGKERLRTHQVPHERGGDEDVGDGRADEPDDDDHLELLEMDELPPPVDCDCSAECATYRRKRNMKRNMNGADGQRICSA